MAPSRACSQESQVWAVLAQTPTRNPDGRCVRQVWRTHRGERGDFPSREAEGNRRLRARLCPCPGDARGPHSRKPTIGKATTQSGDIYLYVGAKG